MYLRYSSKVVAPTHCSSPRASSGLIIDSEVERTFGRPRADERVQFVDEQDDVARARFTSSRMRLTRPSNSPRYLVPATSGPS